MRSRKKKAAHRAVNGGARLDRMDEVVISLSKLLLRIIASRAVNSQPDAGLIKREVGIEFISFITTPEG
jgi:hypothetical protein